MTDPDHAEKTLAMALGAKGYTVCVVRDYLEVSLPGKVQDLAVRCLPNPVDGGRLWFFAGCGDALAPVDRLADALLAIEKRLA